jgi:hypothetical protein
VGSPLSFSYDTLSILIVLGSHLAGATNDTFTTGEVAVGGGFMKERGVGKPWTKDEDSLLIQAVNVHGENDNWKTIALFVPGRTNKACRKVSSIQPRLVILHDVYANANFSTISFLSGGFILCHHMLRRVLGLKTKTTSC